VLPASPELKPLACQRGTFCFPFCPISENIKSWAYRIRFIAPGWNARLQ
jgi:hypothetical protein